MNNVLHIVCLDAPYPPDYGGAIDMYYKIKASAESGAKIHLHYFDYNPHREASGLEEFCEVIHSYTRRPAYLSLPVTKPYIVSSRINQALIDRLNKDNHPILLEGLHCAGIIPHLNNSDRVVLRMHNEEASYYKHLQKTATSFLKRSYFAQESKLLVKYQKAFRKDIKLACLSKSDIETLQSEYGFKSTHFIPCFIPWQKLSIQKGKGDFCLYHGNMTVSENEEAAMWLLQTIFQSLQLPFVIAGKGISKRLQKAAQNLPHVSLISDPSIEKIEELVRAAHINLLPSMNTTGVKLKLLNALLNGRYCITNFNGINGSQIEEGIIIKEHPQEWIKEIQGLMACDFSSSQFEERQMILELYDNASNGQKLSALW